MDGRAVLYGKIEDARVDRSCVAVGEVGYRESTRGGSEPLRRFMATQGVRFCWSHCSVYCRQRLHSGRDTIQGCADRGTQALSWVKGSLLATKDSLKSLMHRMAACVCSSTAPTDNSAGPGALRHGFPYLKGVIYKLKRLRIGPSRWFTMEPMDEMLREPAKSKLRG